MANLEQISPVAVKIGDLIKFTSKDINDSVQYSGKVVAITDYESARAYSDIAASHQAMLAGDPTIDDAETLRFLIVECYDGVRRPFGFQPDGKNSWFDQNYVEVIEVGAEFKIKIFNSSNAEATLALRILREQGFVCKLIQD